MYSALTAASPEALTAETAFRQERLARAWQGSGRWARRLRHHRSVTAVRVPAPRRQPTGVLTAARVLGT
jgi:hypothetical protein